VITSRTTRVVLVLILLVGGGLRLLSAVRAPLEGIETYEYIPTAMTLSWDHHPIRAAQHGAVPAYLIRASAVAFGDSTLGFRMFSVLAGTASILFLYLIAARWWGGVTGLIAAALLAVERYHIAVSARAIDLPFDLFFVALAMYCTSRFLHAIGKEPTAATAGRWLYGAAAATALGFLCKEFTALMMPAILAALLLTRQLSWFRRRELWLAVALFFVLVAPDVYSSLTVTPADRADLFARQKEALRQRGGDLSQLDYEAVGLYMSHGDQLSRFRSIGFNLEPFYFYFGDVFTRLGIRHDNEFTEFPFMRSALSVALWVGLIASLIRSKKDHLTTFLLTMFAFTFVPFSLVQLGAPAGAFETDDKALWYWVDRTMMPAMLLTGHVATDAVQRLTGHRHRR
jgi:4-amino-4-deoxy-L-arabinose transferase-like glycosyltransferase